MVVRRELAKQRKKKVTLLLVGVVLGGVVAAVAVRLIVGVLGL